MKQNDTSLKLEKSCWRRERQRAWGMYISRECSKAVNHQDGSDEMNSVGLKKKNKLFVD